MAIDFVVRTYTAVVMPPEFARWMGTNIMPKKIASQGTVLPPAPEGSNA